MAYIHIDRPLETVDEERGRDLPDSFVFRALNAFAVLLVCVLIVLGLWKLEELLVALIW